jgi:hypothetical protein
MPVPVKLSAFGTRSSPVVWQTHLGADRTRNAVLVGYETYVGTTVRLAETPDPDDGALAQIALEPQLGRLRRALASSADLGLSRRGRVVAVARVESVRGTEAIVVGCLDATGQRLYDSAGRPVRGWHAGVSVARARLRRVDGRWQVYALVALPLAHCHR